MPNNTPNTSPIELAQLLLRVGILAASQIASLALGQPPRLVDSLPRPLVHVGRDDESRVARGPAAMELGRMRVIGAARRGALGTERDGTYYVGDSASIVDVFAAPR